MELIRLLLLALGINLIGFSMAYEAASDKLTDFSYGATFLVLAFFSFLSGPKELSQTFLFILIALWAMRLADFLVLRILMINKDHRFDGVREDFWKFAKFWIGQAVAAWVILLPAELYLHSQEAHFGVMALIGWFIALAGITIETIADSQKYNFNLESQNYGKWMEKGLWRFSRHPNYFGEILMWLGVYVFCFPYLSNGARLVSLASPFLITGLLLFVTGIPKLEAYADKKWGKNPDYKKYKESTSLLIPLPRRLNKGLKSKFALKRLAR